MTKEVEKQIEFQGQQISFKTGRLAPRAESSILARIGDTVVFTVVSMSKEDSDLDYFPLSVEYLEKFYAGGVISGSRFIKREGRPSDDAVLKARQVDHSIRSLFPKGLKREVNVVVNVMAYDGVNNPETLAVTSASMALMISSIPFMGPSASVMVGVRDNEFVLNPNEEMIGELDSEFIVSVREGRILNIEGWGDELPEAKLKELIDFAVEKSQPLLDVQKEMQKEYGKSKMEVADLPVAEELIDELKSEFKDKIEAGLYDSETRFETYLAVRDAYLAKFTEAEPAPYSGGQVMEAIDYIASKIMREGVLKLEKRTSGRKLDEVRELDTEVSMLPRVHGSALFQRGKTQCLSIVTLGSLRLAQQFESFEGESEKTFMHHYHGPNYSFGQAGRFSYYPGRREIGHGNIGENALKKMLPSTEAFPYTIRVVSEVLSQMGSSSMAASCGTSMALMDAGVPIKAAVAGVSVGLITDKEEQDYKILTDIEDVEDFYGDMDFKITGTTQGVTAIQLDNKLMGVPVNILKDAIDHSRNARLKILEAMSKAIAQPREQLNEFAPKVEVIQIDTERIGELIGPGGSNIKSILEQAGKSVDIEIQDDGRVIITGAKKEERERAVELVKIAVEEPEIGKVYDAVVDSVKEYGAFIDATPKISGLVHKSEISNEFVNDPSQYLEVGQKIKAKLIKSEKGKLSFTLKGLDNDLKKK